MDTFFKCMFYYINVCFIALMSFFYIFYLYTYFFLFFLTIIYRYEFSTNFTNFKKAFYYFKTNFQDIFNDFKTQLLRISDINKNAFNEDLRFC